MLGRVMGQMLSSRDRRGLRLLPGLVSVAVLVLALYVVGASDSPRWVDLLVLITAFLGSAVTVHYTFDGEVFTLGLIEASVGLAAGAGVGGWGAVSLAVGIVAGYFTVKMRQRPVPAAANSAMYVTGAVVGLSIARIWVAGGALVPVACGVAAVVTSLIAFGVSSPLLAYFDQRPLRAAIRFGWKGHLVQGVGGMVAAATLGWLADADVRAAVAAVATASLMLPLSTARLKAWAERDQLRRTLRAATELLNAPNPAEAEAVLLAAARALTGDAGVRLAEADNAESTACLTVPVPTSTGNRLALVTDAPRELPLHQPVQAMLHTLAQCAGVALDATRQRQHWRHLAEHDPLTGLLNRHAFDEALTLETGRTRPLGAGLAVVFVDLNGFKAVNDTFGHEAGDRVLREVAQQLRLITREQDYCARIGGDEFCLLLVDQPGTGSAHDLADRVRAAVARAAHHADADVSCSVGIAQYPDDGDKPGELLRTADQRMYDNKKKSIDGAA